MRSDLQGDETHRMLQVLVVTGLNRKLEGIGCLGQKLTRNSQGCSVHIHHETWGCHVIQIVFVISGHYRIPFWGPAAMRPTTSEMPVARETTRCAVLHLE